MIIITLILDIFSWLSLLFILCNATRPVQMHKETAHKSNVRKVVFDYFKGARIAPTPFCYQTLIWNDCHVASYIILLKKGIALDTNDRSTIRFYWCRSNTPFTCTQIVKRELSSHDTVSGFAMLKISKNPNKTWTEITPPTHPHPFFLGNPSLTWTEHSHQSTNNF